MSRYTEEQKQQLRPYVTSTEGGIFVVKNLRGLAGAIYARYSRAQGGVREVILREFMKDGIIDEAKIHGLIERILIAFGDDSVGELEPIHVSFEGISILATKELEDRRIGGSPIEQSTRYVFYDQKDENGNWLYYRDPEIMASRHAEAYVSAMDFAFTTYQSLIEPLQQHYFERYPIENAEYDINGDGVKEKLSDLTDEKEIKGFRITYKADMKTKACDTLRALLPIATKTNVGIMGNGRFFQGAISHCMASPLAEARNIAAEAFSEISKELPVYVKRARASGYLQSIANEMEVLAKELFAGIVPTDSVDVHMMDSGEEHIAAAAAKSPGDVNAVRNAMRFEEDVLTMSVMLYPYLSHSLQQIRDVVRDLSPEMQALIRAIYLGKRENRRDRPGRAFEASYPFTFDMCTDFGTYKDLMRHRMSTQVRQKFTPKIGFAMPKDIVAIGREAEALAVHERMVDLYDALVADFPHAASYATLHGSKVRWVIGLNDRAAMHLIELRTTPQGHPSYRRVAQLMHDEIMKKSEWRGQAIAFADHNDYTSARGDSEAKQRAREAELEKIETAAVHAVKEG